MGLAGAAELHDPDDPRHAYPYINCTDCGPRWSIITDLPYDRTRTTMAPWPLDAPCRGEYHDPASRRFHAEPVACARCGPGYRFERLGKVPITESAAAVAAAAHCLSNGGVVAAKGVGGYHLMCDASDAQVVRALRERKFRKEKPFALLVPDSAAAERLVELSDTARRLLESPARPIVLAPARMTLEGVAPGCRELGVMLPSTPMQLLLFAAGAPTMLVCTSANRSSEPIASDDDDARTRLDGIADAFLIGERPIERRVEDSVVRDTAAGPMILRRSRGYAPGAVTRLPVERPILALGADLKNTVTLVVDGHAFPSQHLGDLDDWQSNQAFRQAVRDLLHMYRIDLSDCVVAADAHPQYLSRRLAASMESAGVISCQHHRAHIASVIAERQAWDRTVVGVSFDGTGYGDDGTIWGGEFLVGSLRGGLRRAGHLLEGTVMGGDAAVRLPAQCAAGFVGALDAVPDLTAPPFDLPAQYRDASVLLARAIRTVATTSMGRLFDTAAALVGFTGHVSYEGQAAIWLEELAHRAEHADDDYPMPYVDGILDFRPLLSAIITARVAGRAPARIARGFHRSVAVGTIEAAAALAGSSGADTIVCSGGVFQNQLLLEDVYRGLSSRGLEVWFNSKVPPNDGGISLGQAAMAALSLGTTNITYTAGANPPHDA